MELVAHAVGAAKANADFAAPFLIESTVYMQEAAKATTIAMVLGFALALCWLWVRFSAPPPFATILRMGLAAVVLYGVDLLLPLSVEMVGEYGKITFLAMVAGKMAVMGLIILVVLAITREFTRTDLDRFLAVIGKKKKPQQEVP